MMSKVLNANNYDMTTIEKQNELKNAKPFHTAIIHGVETRFRVGFLYFNHRGERIKVVAHDKNPKNKPIVGFNWSTMKNEFYHFNQLFPMRDDFAKFWDEIFDLNHNRDYDCKSSDYYRQFPIELLEELKYALAVHRHHCKKYHPIFHELK